jgi:hypothetical protein
MEPANSDYFAARCLKPGLVRSPQQRIASLPCKSTKPARSKQWEIAWVPLSGFLSCFYLPKEKVLCTGDFGGPFLTYMGDGYIDEWDDTLEKLKSIDFDIILPGHGNPMRTAEKIEHFQAYLRDLWNKTAGMKRKGASAEEVANKNRLNRSQEELPRYNGPWR